MVLVGNSSILDHRNVVTVQGIPHRSLVFKYSLAEMFYFTQHVEQPIDARRN